MNLTEAEYHDFLFINQSLLLYAGKHKGILNEKLTLIEFRNGMEAKTVLECADAFYDNLKILDKFLKENPAKLDAVQLKVAVENDIENLVAKHPNLLPLYHQEWGRVNSIFYKKQFKNLGLNKSYYALLQGQIIASALKQKELESIINQLVPASKKAWVYTFKM